ncbi:alpha/beta hydrolase [Blastococcus sp. PRF04-17]|uniref:alpha/beta hydrolase n=1 Tax=Blastococcus sp. PRF04-17 TaxID=2933797 RepID=UPI001FF21D9D|nr:alpha/beta hydrolase [Blastococcus sp. PRF04-17]UOY02523.1 alpha/beta hydrolase [Blastococcus sp. PRF04-17]
MSWQMSAVGLVLRATRKRAFATAERGRRRIAQPKVEAPPPRKLTARHEVTQRTVGGFPVWTVRPRTGSGRAAVYLHGGAYIAGITPQHWALIGRLADAGVRVEVPLYGLAPQHSYREAYAFAHEVYAQLAAENPEEGIALVGDSAGGGLALGLAQELIGDPHLSRVVLISPWLDLTLSHPDLATIEDPWLATPGLHEAAAAWADGDDPTAPRLSPGNGPLEGLPPTTVLVGTRELCLPDSTDFVAAARKAGAEVEIEVVEGALHVYPLLPAPEGAEGTRRVVAAVTAGAPTRPR